ncbi:MAG: hypothetical protein IT473_10570 [Lysobacter sp.]|nr:hypothetical protein [Lysobacter sp.]
MTTQSRSIVPAIPTMPVRRAALAAVLGLFAGLAMTAAPQVQAQEAAQAPPRAAGVRPLPDQKIPTLGCCRCLGDKNTLDLSTIPGNPWKVNGVPAAFVTPKNAAWSNDTGGAKWIGPNAAGSGGNNTTYLYTLQFKVEKCTIPQTIVFKGNSAAADNYIKVSLTGPTSGGPVQCNVPGGYCFTAANQLNNFAAWPVVPGLYTLNVEVNNISGPTGMFINASVEGQCTKEPAKPEKGRDI